MTWEASLLKSVHLAGEDESDDLYADFDNDNNPAFDTEELYEDEGFQQALKSSYGKRMGTSAGRMPPGTSARLGTAMGRGGKVPGSSMGGRPMTGVAADPAQARPMTAVRAAGYSSAGTRTVAGNSPFDPLNQARGPAPPLEEKNTDSPEEKIRALERQTMALIEESSFAAEKKDYQLALEKAREAGRVERTLCRHREQSELTDQMNLDITYSVLFNLAVSYHRLQMYNEAINTYNVIVKNKMFSNAGRLRINIGNIYYEQHKYTQAVKYYRMALDQVPQTHKLVRIRMSKNIATVFVKMGQYSDAITTLEPIMNEHPEVETGFNLLLCAYALDDKERMKKYFNKLTQTSDSLDDEKYTADTDDHHSQMILEAIRDDPLRKYEKEKETNAERCILMGAKLIAPVVEDTFDEGFDWCTEVVKNSPYIELANELEITRSIVYLKMKDFSKATETLKKFEKKTTKMQSQASVNLSFLYFLEGEITQSEKHADIAINSDRYNPAALLNKGNNEFEKGSYAKAKECFSEALNIEATCVEALYNLGLCFKKSGEYDTALECFHKLHNTLPNNTQVMCQLALLYELTENISEAIEWYHQFLTLVPTDPDVLRKVGLLYEREGDKSQAFQFVYESYRYYPSNMETITWLGSYYVEAQFIEKAVTYFERAVQVEPLNVKWPLMLSTCYRKAGNYGKAMETYKEIHEQFPENLDCLRFLAKLCKDQGLVEQSEEYNEKLKKVKKTLAHKEQRANSGRRGSSARSRNSSAKSDTARSQSPDDFQFNNRDTLSPRERVSSGRTKDPKKIDASYNDPLGEAPSRPKTSGGRGRPQETDDFADEEIGDDLLPM